MCVMVCTGLGWTLLVGSSLSAAAYQATPLARSPLPVLVHTCGQPITARHAVPPAPARIVMTFGDTVTEVFGGIAAILAVVALTSDDGDGVESEQATEAGANAKVVEAVEAVEAVGAVEAVEAVEAADRPQSTRRARHPARRRARRTPRSRPLPSPP